MKLITATAALALIAVNVDVAHSADNKQHPLHGPWISQSGSSGEGRVTVTFYPDGTFHMVQTVEGDDFIAEDWDDSEEEGWEDFPAEEDSNDNEVLDEEEDSEEESWEDFMAESDSNDNEVLDEEDFEAAQARGDDLPPSWDHVLYEIGDANGDGVIDQEEYETKLASEEAWEELLAEVDSNDNEVIDEEDFEAAQARGDDLPPSWDDMLQDMGDANGDGVIDQEEFEGKNPDADWQEEAFVVEPPGGLFDEEMIMTMVMTGTWEAVDDQFTLVNVELVFEVNDMTLLEFSTLLFGSLFDLAFQESGLSEEEFLSMMVLDNPDSIDTPETLEEFIEFQIELMIEEITTGMTRDMPEVETFVYSIDGDEMIATDSDGETIVFMRLDTRSAVEASTWGQIKALHR